MTDRVQVARPVVAGADVADELLVRSVEGAGYRALLRERRAVRQGH
jgi:hypothetical protein